jgi:hypothetical protein
MPDESPHDRSIEHCRAIRRAGCFHYKGHDNPCHASASPYIAIFGVMQIVFSQIPDLDKVWWLSIVAAIMSFSYSTIGVSLGVAEIAGTPLSVRRTVSLERIHLC